jgi:hypothetical protein
MSNHIDLSGRVAEILRLIIDFLGRLDRDGKDQQP